ncbi:PREDICTED: uncharacterized protein LOC104776662 [Camelina sativa]|uniref:Uncharacterized protein LOC104776662 n=1 Tax=Camelina sativa TaxID=90675 RepID=A0ABM0YCT8_CAMSA|nr:PREDICTED: uncharacterized protein LOC104776662 [Camelina sativa]
MSESTALVPARSKTRRTIDPYDLSSGDNPGSVISQPLLRGPNYDEWSTNIRLALKARKKFGFVDGTIPEPTVDSEDLEDLGANNAMVISWLKLTIDENLRTSLSNHENAHELWKHIKQRSSVRNGQRVQRLKAELATCTQKGLAMQDYYGKLTQLWRSLSDYQQAKTVEEIAKGREEDKLHQFLMGLDETIYGAVKSSLLSRVPLPTLDEAYQILAQDEESKSASRVLSNRVEEMSFAVQTQGSQRSVHHTRNRHVCTSCGKTDHFAENCFRKIGYPDWWVERSAPSSRPRQMSLGSPQVPNTGKGLGHPPARANSIVAVPSTPSTGVPQAAANSVLSVADRIGLTGLTNAQWESLKLALDERDKTSTTLLGPHYQDVDWFGGAT